MKIECTVKTPQHKDEKVDHWLTQKGMIDTDTWVFEPFTYENGGHSIRFGDEKTFKKFKA